MEPRSGVSPNIVPAAEPTVATPATAGSSSARALDGALAIAEAWVAGRCEAMILAGSHATGEGVWCIVDGRETTLSDLDLYAVMPDEAACRAAEAAARHDRPDLGERLAALGIAGPLEVCFRTRAGLARLPAKPGTIELARHGRVVRGDARALEALPRWTAADVSREERLLLLENRGFELLMAAPSRARGTLVALRSRHALLKAAADLATVLALAEGTLPDGTGARIDWATGHALPGLEALLPLEHQAGVRALRAVWDAARAWRAGAVVALPPEAAAAEWLAAVRAWCAVWWAAHGEGPREPWARALRVAARAPMRRRARQALVAASRGGARSPLGARLRAALAGTPQHRVNATAAVLLLAAASSTGTPALPAGALRALHALGVTDANEWDPARRDAVRAWDLWVLDGQRTAGEPE